MKAAATKELQQEQLGHVRVEQQQQQSPEGPTKYQGKEAEGKTYALEPPPAAAIARVARAASGGGACEKVPWLSRALRPPGGLLADRF